MMTSLPRSCSIPARLISTTSAAGTPMTLASSPEYSDTRAEWPLRYGSFVIALESKDPYLKGHSARVSLYSGELATVMGVAPADVVMMSRAGMLHDLGKLVIMDNILRKPRQ